MYGTLLSIAIDNADSMIEDGIRGVLQEKLAQHTDVHQLCTFFRQRGVATMLRDGQPDAYHLNAMQSAAVFARELHRVTDDEKVTSYARPLFDAFGSGYWDGAAEIAARSRMTWNPDREYEDDFLYVQFLLAIGTAGAETAADTSLERWARVVGSAPAVRLDICRALLDRDELAFDAHLRELLDERQRSVAARVARGTYNDEVACWLQPFALEGVALLKLAERLGISTSGPYLHCPDILRPDSPFVYDPRAWMNPDFVPVRR